MGRGSSRNLVWIWYQICGKLLVAAQLVAGDVGHDLFMGHAEAQVGALAVLQAEHVVAHQGPAAGLPPQIGGMDGGQEEFLADAVHLFAHDGDDLVDGALAEEEVGIDAGAELADVSGANEELVAGHFGVSRSFAESGDEELRPAMHAEQGAFVGTAAAEISRGRDSARR